MRSGSGAGLAVGDAAKSAVRDRGSATRHGSGPAADSAVGDAAKSAELA